MKTKANIGQRNIYFSYVAANGNPILVSSYHTLFFAPWIGNHQFYSFPNHCSRGNEVTQLILQRQVKNQKPQKENPQNNQEEQSMLQANVLDLIQERNIEVPNGKSQEYINLHRNCANLHNWIELDRTSPQIKRPGINKIALPTTSHHMK